MKKRYNNPLESLPICSDVLGLSVLELAAGGAILGIAAGTVQEQQLVLGLHEL